MNLPETQDAGKGYARALLRLAVIVVLLFCGIMCLWPRHGGRTAARRIASTGNLKQIAVALHNYYDTYGQLPPAYTVDKFGEPLHSWRVLLLPFLDHDTLYEQFDLDSPWFSDANRELISQMPDVYVSPFFRETGHEGETPYRAVVDKLEQRTLFLPEKGRNFSDVPDGLSNTVMVIDDPGRMVTWTKPDDIGPLELLALTPMDQMSCMAS